MQERRPTRRGDATGDRWVKELFQEMVLVDARVEGGRKLSGYWLGW